MVASSPGARLHYEEVLFFAACVCNCWGVCLCVCVCLENRGCRGGMRLGSSWRWQLSRAMRLALRWCRRWRSSRRTGVWRAVPAWRPALGETWAYCRLLLKSLYHNSLCNSDTMLDAAFEPVYWIVDNVTRWFGVVFVSLVIVLTGSVLVIVYLCLLPLVLSTYPVQWIVWHLCYGHWLLIMTVFHYYKATTTKPGHPPKDKADIPSVSICKKCIIPKPARTHHCSICNMCILKMDHHCPWLNNCVGHFNHRYFFSFCLYMTLGCMYCSVSCKDMFLDAYNAVEQYRIVQEAWAAQQGVPDSEMKIHSYNMTGQSYYQTPPPTFTFRETTSHKSIIFLWVLTSSVSVALGGLTLWHSILISRAETSVERHINHKETRRLREQGKGFRNPYHHGHRNNWKIFLGVEKRSHWVTRVLMPSSHLPTGDGIVWECSFTRHDPMAI